MDQRVEEHEIFTEGDDLFEAMLSDIASAQDVILLEMYIFKEDRIGKDFVAALLRAADRGIDVHVRLDALGSCGVFKEATVRKLRERGVTFCWDGEWNWRHPLRYQRRNHRKLLVIDDNIAFVGGFNISEDSSLRLSGSARWRDTHIRLRGPIAKQAAELFRSHRSSNACGEERWFGPSLLMSNFSRRCRYRLRCLFAARFRKAVSKIWLTTPYFVPDSRTRRLLIEAAERGLDVRLLVPSKSDVPLTQWAARNSYESLVRSGVSIYEYLPRFLHAKTVVVDEDWCTIGTSNFDYRSFFKNLEINFVSVSHDVNAKLSEDFAQDLKSSKKVERRKTGPFGMLGLFQRLVAHLARKYL